MAPPALAGGYHSLPPILHKQDQNSITDSAVSALMAQAGVESAILNVTINLGSIKDEKFVNSISTEIKKLKDNANKKTNEIINIVSNKI